MSTYREFLVEVMPEVPGCPLFLAENHIRNAVIDFCDLSSVWRYEADAELIGGDESYTFSPPTNSIVARVLNAWVNSSEVFSKSPSELASMYGDWRAEVGGAQFITSLTPREYKIVPNPSVNDGQQLTMLVALKPTRASTSCPDFLLEDWIEEISHGAKAKLMRLADKPWTSKESALMHEQRFKSGANSAQSRAEHGFGRSSMVIKPREFV